MRIARAGLRGRLLLSVIGAIGLVLAGLTLAFNLVLDTRLDTDATGVVQARASAELASLRVSNGRILLPEAPDERSPDIQTWVFEGPRVLEQPRAAQPTNAAAAGLARAAPARRDISSTNTRLLSVPVVQTGHRLGAVVAAASLAPYAQTRHTALVASVILALAVLATVGLAARWLIDRALRPVAHMTRQAADWSEHELDRRFALGPPQDELTQLASTLDDLLERLAASLRHEQRLSAEISHELRTPLANIVAEAQYALRHSKQTEEGKATLEHILQSARQLGRTLETLMSAARAQLDPNRATSDAIAAVQRAIRASGLDTSQLEVKVDASPGQTRVAVESDLVERILVPILENAGRHAHHSINIDVATGEEGVQLAIQDDGPGVPAEAGDAIFEPGQQAAAAAGAVAVRSSGAGLGLALCRRLARSAGGEVLREPSDAGGRFVLRLPAA